MLHGGVAKPGVAKPNDETPFVLSASSHWDLAANLASSSQRPRDESCFRSCWLFRSAPSAMISTSSFGPFSLGGLDMGDVAEGGTGDARVTCGDRRRGVRQVSGTTSCASVTIAGINDHAGVAMGATGCARSTGTGTSRRGPQASGRRAKSTASSVLQPALVRNKGVEQSLAGSGLILKGAEVSAHGAEVGGEGCRLLALPERGGEVRRRLDRGVQVRVGEHGRGPGTHGGCCMIRPAEPARTEEAGVMWTSQSRPPHRGGSAPWISSRLQRQGGGAPLSSSRPTRRG